MLTRSTRAIRCVYYIPTHAYRILSSFLWCTTWLVLIIDWPIAFRGFIVGVNMPSGFSSRYLCIATVYGEDETGLA